MRKWSGHDRNHGMIRMIEPAGRGRPRQSTDEMLGRCRDPFIARRDPKHDRAQFVRSASIAILPEGGGLRPAVGREIDLSLDQPLAPDVEHPGSDGKVRGSRQMVARRRGVQRVLPS